MKKELMAKLIARVCYKTKLGDDDPLFAVQLFMEDLVVPESVNDYTEEQMSNWILEYLLKSR